MAPLKCYNLPRESELRPCVKGRLPTGCKEKDYSDQKESAAVRHRLRRCRPNLRFLDS